MKEFNEDDLPLNDVSAFSSDEGSGAYFADRPVIAGEQSDAGPPPETEPESLEEPDSNIELPVAAAEEAMSLEIDSLVEPAQAEEQVDEVPADEWIADESPNKSKGLLAAASAMYEIDNFDRMDEDSRFIDILQEELKKSEAAGNEFTLLSIGWTAPGLETEPLIQQAAAFFKYGSRVFEKDEQDGIYIIVPDSGLDEVFAAAKEFHRRVRETRPPDIYAELLIGLSTRAERSVNAENFLNEVECALDKAHSDSSLPIVAFKADPKKYKEFTSKHKRPA
jgi:hypothetical protein